MLTMPKINRQLLFLIILSTSLISCGQDETSLPNVLSLQTLNLKNKTKLESRISLHTVSNDLNGIITPTIGSTVTTSSSINITFNETMDNASIKSAITVSTIANSKTILISPLSNLYVYSYDDKQNKVTLTLKKNKLLANHTQYEVRLKSGADGVKNQTGDILKSDITSQFTTDSKPDTKAPKIVTVSPMRAEVTTVSSTISIKFNEAMDESTLENNIQLSIINGIAVQTANLSAHYLFTYYPDLNEVTFTPKLTPALLDNTQYRLSIIGGKHGVKDSHGNSLKRTFFRRFSTAPLVDITSPSILKIIPAFGAHVSKDTKISIQFSEALNKQSLLSSFKLFEITGNSKKLVNPFPFRIIYNPVQNKVTLKQRKSKPLFAVTKYQLVIKGGITGISDIHGNKLPKDTISNFTTVTDNKEWT